MPRHVSGTGLVLGSMAPDFGYFLIGATTSSQLWHRPAGAVLLCLPTALVLYWLLTRVVAEPSARHLPMLGGFRLKALGWLAAQPRGARHWMVVAASVLVGVGSHLAWDVFTKVGSPVERRFPALGREAFDLAGQQVKGFHLVWLMSTVVGGLVSLAALYHVGTRDCLRTWAELRAPDSTRGLAPYAPPATRTFWSFIVVALVVGAVAAYLTRPAGFHWHEKATWVVVFLRSTALGFVTLCVAALRERRAFASTNRHQ